ncbi:hypothetical protein ACMFMG_003606 [Clarireedia jacksonii]
MDFAGSPSYLSQHADSARVASCWRNLRISDSHFFCTIQVKQYASNAIATMSILSSFKTLPPRTRAMIGLSFLAWGTIGLFLSDTAEKKLGFEPGGERDPEVASKDGGFRIRVVEK